jgi:hypothetical protein
MRDNLRNSNSDLHIDDVQDAQAITEVSMNALYELVIEPMQDKLTADDAEALGLIAVTLRIVAKKAKAYEELFEKGQSSLPENYQN